MNSRKYHRSCECTGQFFPSQGEKYTYREHVAVAGCRVEICCHKTEGRRQSSRLRDWETQGRGDGFLEQWRKMSAHKVLWRKWLSWFSLNLVLPFSSFKYQKATFPILARGFTLLFCHCLYWVFPKFTVTLLKVKDCVRRNYFHHSTNLSIPVGILPIFI